MKHITMFILIVTVLYCEYQKEMGKLLHVDRSIPVGKGLALPSSDSNPKSKVMHNICST